MMTRLQERLQERFMSKFEDFSNNSINEVNAASSPVPAVGQISTNSINTFSVVGPSNTAVSLTLRKSSYVDPSQYHDDPNMPALEDITYSDDEEDVGAKADFSNLEINITVSHIPITKVHKDQLVTQIIEEPKRVHQALKYPSWIEAMQEELLQFKMQKVWVLVDLPKVVRIEAIRLFLAYASFMGFMVYQMDAKSAFLYGTIEEEDKYVAKILRKFGLTDGKSASTPIDTEKPLLKDPDGEDVDVHTYRSMAGPLMYLTSSRPDIMFAICACAHFQVTPKASHLHAVKRIFRKSTTGGCQFLRCRLISWQCKKQTVVATSSTEAEYVAAASCYAQVLWIQNQLLDYGYINEPVIDL
nr:hypothetical protein [Tanacetum cinerariifolium]